MTRTSLDRTLRRAYIVLGFVLVISIAAKLAPRVPGLDGTPLARVAADIYDYLKDMSLVLVTVVAAYLANVFQKRSKFIERLEEEWRGIVRTKSALYAFCEKQNPKPDEYLVAFTAISETIDNMRVLYGNVGGTDKLIGLYPFAPLHDMRRALQWINPSKRSDVSVDDRRLVRKAVLQAFYALRENFMGELEIGEPDNPIVVSVARRLQWPGVDRRGDRIQMSQLEKYRRSDAPRDGEVEALLWRLHGEEGA